MNEEQLRGEREEEEEAREASGNGGVIVGVHVIHIFICYLLNSLFIRECANCVVDLLILCSYAIKLFYFVL